MDKKKVTSIVLVFAVIAVVGIVLIANNATPYLNCKSWLTDFSYIDGYFYAREHIGEYATGYFSGIILLLVGVIGSIASIVSYNMKKREKPVDQSIVSEFD